MSTATIVLWNGIYFFFRREIFFSDTNMILSRAKPAIGGEKAEEKGGSAGRKQVVWEIQIEQSGGWPYFQTYIKKQPRPIDLLQIHVYTKTFFDEYSREFPWSVVWSDEQWCPISSMNHTCSNSLMSRHQITEVQINNTNTDIQIHLLDLMSTPTCL